MPVTAARLLDHVSTGVPVIRGPVSCELGDGSPPNRELRPSKDLNWGHGAEVHWGHAFRPISAIALHRDSVIAETAFPQGKTLGKRPRNRGRSPSYLRFSVRVSTRAFSGEQVTVYRVFFAPSPKVLRALFFRPGQALLILFATALLSALYAFCQGRLRLLIP